MTVAMHTVPQGRRDAITFFQTHAPVWVERAGEIGVDPELAAQLADATAAAREAYRDQYAAQQAARTATQRLNHAIADMRRLGSGVLGQIGAKAQVAGQGIYPLASVRAPRQPSPIAAPGTPYKLEADLWPTGAIALTWKCNNPRDAEGTVYYVYRRIGDDGPVALLGHTGKKKFVDESLPRNAAAGSVTYQIQPVRSTKAGLAAECTVNFGVSGRRSGATIPPRKVA
jgi:hypothetical protein